MSVRPDQPLDVLRRSLTLLTTGPNQPRLSVPLNDSGTEELAASEVVALLRHGPRHVSDLLWHTVCAHARQGEATWTVIAAGALLPRMVTACTRYARGPEQHIPDVESEVLTAVLEQLRSLPKSTTDVGERLWSASANTAVRFSYVHTRDRRWSARWSPNQVPLDPAAAGRGPVTVVAEAAQKGLVTQVEADLITRTRLERHKLVRVAQEMGLTYITARRWRRAAEERLVSVLVRDEL